MTDNLRELHETISAFLDSLGELVPEQRPKFLLARLGLQTTVPIQEVADRLVRDLLPLKERIANRDENVLLYNPILSGLLEKDDYAEFQRIWASDSVDEEARKAFWLWLDEFVRITSAF